MDDKKKSSRGLFHTVGAKLKKLSKAEANKKLKLLRKEDPNIYPVD